MEIFHFNLSSEVNAIMVVKIYNNYPELCV